MKYPSRLGAMALLAFAACKPRIDISVASARLPRPEFSIRYEDGGFSDGQVRTEAGVVMWAFSTNPARPVSVGVLVYGETPEGFSTTEGPRPLEAGRTYVLELSGRGLGTGRFTPEP